jgi:hypothetical protein
VVLLEGLVDQVFGDVTFDAWCCNGAGDCKGAGGYTEVCYNVGLVDLDLQVDKGGADLFLKLILANGKVNLTTVLWGFVFCIGVLYGPR